jgi:hypothetical protein
MITFADLNKDLINHQRRLKGELLEAVDVQKVIKALIDTSFGGSNEEQMKAVQLLKGLATSDDPKSNKFMKVLDKFTSGLNAEDF